MKKIYISALVSAALMGSVMTSAWAEDGTITFTGSISDTACVISADSKDITVDFGSVSSGYSDLRRSCRKRHLTLT